MARKKKDTQSADAAPEKTTEDATAASTPMVTILKTVATDKISPRGTGRLVYQVGKRDQTVYLRLYKNESSGRMSTEHVPVSALRHALSKVPKGEKLFKSSILAEAWVGRSSTNPGFGCACLKNEGVLASDPQKKGMLMLASPDALDKWEASILALPVPKDAEQVLLHPPKAKPFFARKKDDAAPETAPVADEAEPVDEVDEVEQVDDVEQVDAEDDTAQDDET